MYTHMHTSTMSYRHGMRMLWLSRVKMRTCMQPCTYTQTLACMDTSAHKCLHFHAYAGCIQRHAQTYSVVWFIPPENVSDGLPNATEHMHPYWAEALINCGRVQHLFVLLAVISIHPEDVA